MCESCVTCEDGGVCGYYDREREREREREEIVGHTLWGLHIHHMVNFVHIIHIRHIDTF